MMDPLKLARIMPEAVSLEVTTRCPLNCTYCYRKSNNTPSRDLPLGQFMELKAKLKDMPGLKRLSFCGIGETLTHPDFYRMVHECKDHKVLLVTSGTLPLDLAEANRYGNLDLLIFSVDASSERLIREICGGYNYDNLLRNLKALQDHNQVARGGRGRIHAVINCTVNDLNMDEIPRLIDFAVQHGFISVHYSLPWGKEDFINENRARLRRLFAQALEKARRLGIYMGDPFHSYCCVVVNHVMPYITLNGDVFPCGGGLYTGYRVGNIYENGFVDLWHGPRYQRFKTGELCRGCILTTIRPRENEEGSA